MHECSHIDGWLGGFRACIVHDAAFIGSGSNMTGIQSLFLEALTWYVSRCRLLQRDSYKDHPNVQLTHEFQA